MKLVYAAGQILTAGEPIHGQRRPGINGIPPLYGRYTQTLPALRKGAVKPLFAANQQIAYGRMWGKYQTVTIISNLPQPTTMEIPVWQLGGDR